MILARGGSSFKTESLNINIEAIVIHKKVDLDASIQRPKIKGYINIFEVFIQTEQKVTLRLPPAEE